MITKLKKVFLISLIVIFCFSNLNTWSQEKTIKEDKRVLFISSYGPSFLTFKNHFNIIKSQIPNVQIDVEFMDSKKFKNMENEKNFYNTLDFKLKNSKKYDCVILSDDNALKFYLDYQKILFKKTPYVFLGISCNNLIEKSKKLGFGAGIRENTFAIETINLAKKINNKSKELKIVYDESDTSKKEFKILESKIFKIKGLNIEKIKTNDFSKLEFKKKINKWNKNTIILLISAYEFKDQNLNLEEVIKIFNEYANAPVYPIWTLGIGSGFFASKAINQDEMALEAGKLVRKALTEGQLYSKDINLNLKGRFIADESLVIKNGISKSVFPKKTIFVNKKISLVEKNKKIFIIIGLSFLLLFILVLALFLNIIKRKQMQKELMQKHQELYALYEQIESSEEILKDQYDQLQKNKEIIQKNEQRHRLIFEASNDLLWDYDFETFENYFSNSFYEFFGKENKELFKNISEFFKLIHPDDRDKIKLKFYNLTKDKESVFCLEYRVLCKENIYKWILTTGKVLKDQNGKINRIIGSHSVIDDRKNKEEEIKRLAYFDTITNLGNRTYFNEILKNALNKNEKNQVVCLLDIDDFKFINDTYGHYFGDEFLACISKKIQSLNLKFSFLGRIGGDEFAMIFNQDHIRLDYFIEEIYKLSRKPLEILNKKLYFNFSMGILKDFKKENNITDILRKIDIALYQAKKNGKGKSIIFEENMDEELKRKISLQNDLRNAIENENGLILYYQPQKNIKTMETDGFEALVRWMNPSDGMISPLDFIPLAEESGLIIPMGKWILKTAMQFSKKLKMNYGKEFTIAVNISATQINDPNFVQDFKELFQKEDMTPKMIAIEITESILMESFDSSVKKLEQIQKMGIKISMDDFGTGYSSLNYLRKLPINTLKIDKSFIDDIVNIKATSNLTQFIIKVAQELQMLVIAEGVENQEQLNIIRNFGCDIVQGYYFSKPLSVEDVKKYLEKEK